MTMFALSARAYDFGLRDEAVKMVLSWAKPFNHRVNMCSDLTIN